MADCRLLRLHPTDNVATVLGAVEAGQTLDVDQTSVTLAQRIPSGHKVAIAPIVAGEKVIKYGAPIGSATRDIQPGDYVHAHNLKSDYLPARTTR